MLEQLEITENIKYNDLIGTLDWCLNRHVRCCDHYMMFLHQNKNESIIK